MEDSRTGKPMDFIPEVEDEVIRESVSYKLYISIVNPLNKNWRYYPKTKTPTSPLQIGEYLRYTNYGHNDMVDLVDIKTNM